MFDGSHIVAQEAPWISWLRGSAPSRLSLLVDRRSKLVVGEQSTQVGQIMFGFVL